MSEKQILQKRVKQILANAGIRMEICGCGCCGSPWVKFEHNGELIVDYYDSFNLNMFEQHEGDE